jgi:nicotinamide mononucleotide transporter
MIDWLIKNWVELFGVISALVYLWLSIKQHIWLWPWGALSSAIYIVVYFSNKFYADMGLQVYYLIISFYGWYAWLHPGNDQNKIELAVTSVNKHQIIILTGLSVILWILMAIILDKFTDSPVPWGDGFTTAFAITATWMLARKIMEHWLVWIVVDAVAMLLYFNRTMYLTAFLFLVYTLMAVVGYTEWRKKWKSDRLQPR